MAALVNRHEVGPVLVSGSARDLHGAGARRTANTVVDRVASGSAEHPVRALPLEAIVAKPG
jgi:hypothetical protein